VVYKRLIRMARAVMFNRLHPLTVPALPNESVGVTFNEYKQ